MARTTPAQKPRGDARRTFLLLAPLFSIRGQIYAEERRLARDFPFQNPNLATEAQRHRGTEKIEDRKWRSLSILHPLCVSAALWLNCALTGVFFARVEVR